MIIRNNTVRLYHNEIENNYKVVGKDFILYTAKAEVALYWFNQLVLGQRKRKK